MISAMVAQAAIETKRREGVAMAHSLYALLAGRMQFRFLRHMPWRTGPSASLPPPHAHCS
jgi:hypothetical protein